METAVRKYIPGHFIIPFINEKKITLTGANISYQLIFGQSLD